MSAHKTVVIHSIDDLVRNGFQFQKMRKKQCPEMEQYEAVEVCNNPVYKGNICHFGCNYKNCPYYKQR